MLRLGHAMRSAGAARPEGTQRPSYIIIGRPDSASATAGPALDGQSAADEEARQDRSAMIILGSLVGLGCRLWLVSLMGLICALSG
jgi:hypothetical protein